MLTADKPTGHVESTQDETQVVGGHPGRSVDDRQLLDYHGYSTTVNQYSER